MLTVFNPEVDAIDFYESLEGMRVQLNHACAVGPQKYGEVPVTVANGREKLQTANGGRILTEANQNPDRLFLNINDTSFVAKTGDCFDGSITGVVGYTYNNFKIMTDKHRLPNLIKSEVEQEVTAIVKDESKLTVANYNVENLSARTSDTKIEKIAQSFITNLKSPDIIGLVEIQDNDGETDSGTTVANETYEKLIAKIKALGGPSYDFTDIAPENNQDGGVPGGNIRVGFLYNTERVKLAEGKEAGTATQSVEYLDGALTLNPGRIDPTNTAFENSRKPLAAEFVFNGEKVIVINNHFNSKRGDQPLFGKNQPPVFESEKQRHQIATIIHNFVQDVQTKNPQANVVVLGDLNDYQFSKTLDIVKGNQLTNMIDTLPLNEQYTYVYEGNSQVLDHILVSNHLASQTEIDIVNINADFMEAHGRASDHDPVVVQMALDHKKDEDFHLTIMHTNDTHAHLDNVARRITAINTIREEVEHSILLDAGDVFSGTLFFNQYLGQADLEFMNMVGYDAMVPGNHEFDKGSEVLANFIKNAHFPFVSANVDYSQDPELSQLAEHTIGKSGDSGKLYPAIIMEIDEEEIGVFGLTTEDTAYLANPGEQITFEDYLEKAHETVAMLEEEGVNKIVALTHLGHQYDVKLAEEVSGIDVIIGGHSHTKIDQAVVLHEETEPTIVVQAQDYGVYIGRMDVEFDEHGVLQQWHSELVEVDEKNEAGEYIFAEDMAAAERLEVLKEPIEELKQTVIGKSTVDLDGERENVRTKETNLGNLIADGMLAKAKESVNAQIAIQNGGGIRASIRAGDVTLGDVLTVLPFANNLVALELTGTELLEALENGVSQVESAQGRFLQVAGLRFSYDRAQPAFERVYDVEIETETGYVPLDENATYIVATNEFIADGGDGFESLKRAKDDGRMMELFLPDYDVFTEFLEKLGTVGEAYAEPEGRIIEAEKMEDTFTIPDIAMTVTQYKKVKLPKKVKAIMNDGSVKKMEITWDGSIDSSIVGEQIIEGTVEGYSKKVILTVTVEPAKKPKKK
ncbi:5'-nucleotidase C-terminal domain-containing protein [Halalkalibacter urbisdiaboli]|uniref:5'-nucleotidase C-terminal domain-containing protein n=1 Tax=Halalkalibacter urbisdiaboli TaxID=1960589 RepID=UPI003CC96712